MYTRIYSLIFLLCLTSCATYKIPTHDFLPPPQPTCPVYQNKVAANSHWLYTVIPRHRTQIVWYDLGHWCTWALFGNDDDGIFGEELSRLYCPNTPLGLGKALRWNLRNPLHNFTYYVIGTAYMTNSEFTVIKISPDSCSFLEYHAHSTTVFADKRGGFYLGFHGWKPFISLRLPICSTRKFDLYLGWREKGNFGLKFLPFRYSQP